MEIKLPSHLHRSQSGVLHFRIAIPPDLRHHFASREIYRSLRTPGCLFPELSQRRDGSSHAASNWLQRYKKRCGIEGEHTKVFHSFRHTFISTLMDNDVPEHAVAQIVGHEAQLITGQVYWNARDAAKRKPTVEKYQPPSEVWSMVPKL